jgi:trehalose/maltose hydrolase-like predicted phosphorylase/CheY-like chemotaxis protein
MLPNYSDEIKKDESTSSWKVIYNGFRPAKESLRESLCSLGNGYFATRGAMSESWASRVHYPGTYMAGVYNKLASHVEGRTIYNEGFVNCPNWLPLTFRMGGGDWILPSNCKILSYYQELDMQRGVLIRKMRLQDNKGNRVKIETQRIVHMANPHCAAIKYVISPENYEGPLIIRTALDGTVQNTGVARYRQLNSKHLKPNSCGHFARNGIYLSMKTSESDVKISQASKIHIFSGGKEVKPRGKVLRKDRKRISQEFKIKVSKKKQYEIEKTVAIYTSKDKGVRNHLSAAVNSAKNLHRFEALFKTHRQAWNELWKTFDIRIEGDHFVQKVLRLHTFHLLQTASMHNTTIDAGFPARGLHGEAYRGHIFWDQLFAMPFFDFRAHDISKAMIMYRYRRLDAARAAAKEAGYNGAMFPWQSGSSGEEETQLIHLNPLSGKWGPDHSHIQRHVSFAVAYNTWQYWRRTGDRDFLSRYGAEILLSIAQFGASLAKHSPKDGRYHTDGVMGPDEFHEKYPGAVKSGFRDNTYTNLLIVWTLLKAEEALFILPKNKKEQLFKKLGITQSELNRWADITRKMKIVINEEGIISQFEGYFKLKGINLDTYRKKYGNIQRMDRILKAEGKSPNEYKVAKQADVLMIFYLLPIAEVRDLFHRLGYKLDKDMVRENYDYYLKRTSHGSTLSKVVHCQIAFMLGRSTEALDWYWEVLKSDIYDIQGGTTAEGIHTGVMGGSINIIFRSFAGIDILDDRIKIEPFLPKRWGSIKFRFCYKGHWIFLFITKDHVAIFIRGPKSKPFPIPVEIYGKRHYLLFGIPHKISLEKGTRIVAWREGLKMVQERILVVDGDMMLSALLKSRLEAKGYLVDCVYSGSKAIDILQTEWVDLIVLAVVLQGEMSGYRLFKEIKNKKKFSKIPIVMQSGKAAMKDIFEKMGAEAFFVKPYSIDSFLDEIEDILTRKGISTGF